MCFVCERIQQTKEGNNPFLVKELETGYVVIGDSQYIKGYTLFLCKIHETELFFLESSFRNRFMEEMSMVAEAVYNAFKPDKMNYELLGKGEGVHMHWHLFPRRENDTPTGGPVWKVPNSEMYADVYSPQPKELEKLKTVLGHELDLLMQKKISV